MEKLLHKPSVLYLLIILAFVVPGCSGNKTASSVEQEKTIPDTLRVAIELSPMSMSTNGDSISGYSYELLCKLSDDHGLPFRLTAYNNITDALERSDDFHLIISNIPITASLRDQYIFTDPLYTDYQVLIQNTDNTADSLIKSQQELGEQTVWVAKNSPITERLRNLAQEMGTDINIREMENLTEEQLIILVSEKEIPRAAVSRRAAAALSEHYPSLDFSTDLSFNQFKSWILNPADSVLRDSLNSWIDRVRTTEWFANLNKKYHND